MLDHALDHLAKVILLNLVQNCSDQLDLLELLESTQYEIYRNHAVLEALVVEVLHWPLHWLGQELVTALGYHVDHLVQVAHLQEFFQKEGYLRLQGGNLVKEVEKLEGNILMEERWHEILGIILQ